MCSGCSAKWTAALAVESDAALPLESLIAKGVRDWPDVAGLAALNGRRLTLVCWHYHDDDLPGAAADVALDITHLPGHASRARLEHFRIDEFHSNAYAEWKRMGSPTKPSKEQYTALQRAGLWPACSLHERSR